MLKAAGRLVIKSELQAQARSTHQVHAHASGAALAHPRSHCMGQAVLQIRVLSGLTGWGWHGVALQRSCCGSISCGNGLGVSLAGGNTA